MRLAVVGHVEWIDFVLVDRPPHPGEILRSSVAWDEPAGGGAVAAVELARLAGSCTLFTAVGDDGIGAGIAAALAPHGVEVVAAVRPGPHRRGITLIDPSGERTITVIGPAQAPVGAELGEALSGFDGVYWCHGDAESLRFSRSARVLVATARKLDALREAEVPLDALVRSAADPRERYSPGALVPAPALVAATEGASGGAWRAGPQEGRWSAVEPVGPIVDTYGAGDCFAAALTFALARYDDIEDALTFAAERGAEAVTRRGAHGVAPEV